MDSAREVRGRGWERNRDGGGTGDTAERRLTGTRRRASSAPPLTTSRHYAFRRAGLGRGWQAGYPSAPQPGCPPRSHLWLGGGAPRGRRARRDPADSAEGARPPGQGRRPGRGDPNAGGCHASRALGNLGLGRPRAAAAAPRTLRPPARAACAGEPPPLRSRLPPPQAAPTRPRPAHSHPSGPPSSRLLAPGPPAAAVCRPLEPRLLRCKEEITGG